MDMAQSMYLAASIVLDQYDSSEPDDAQTLRQHVHRIIDLNVHMIANCSQLVLFRGDDFAVEAFDFP